MDQEFFMRRNVAKRACKSMERSRFQEPEYFLTTKKKARVLSRVLSYAMK